MADRKLTSSSSCSLADDAGGSASCLLLVFCAQIPGPGERDIPEFDGRELELMSMRPEEDVVLTLQDLMPDTQSVQRPDDKALGILIVTRYLNWTCQPSRVTSVRTSVRNKWLVSIVAEFLMERCPHFSWGNNPSEDKGVYKKYTRNVSIRNPN